MPAELYPWMKLLHLVAVVLFLGNVTFGLFWVAHAERSGEPRLIAHAMHGVIRSDRPFTVPGVLLIIGAGVAAALIGRLPLLRTAWIAWSLGLFALSGIVFGAVLAPLQRRIVELARRDAVDGAALARLLALWHRWGWASLLPLWIALAMMVLKRPA